MKNKKDNKIQFTCKSIGEYVLFEGTSEALKLIGNMFIKQSEVDDCRYYISPRGAGSIFFNEGSNRGIYIHRLPCENGKIKLSHKRIIEEYSSKLKPAKFENIFNRVKKQWPKIVDISDGYIIEESNGYYSSNLSEIYNTIEDKLDPTNDWDNLMCWTLFGLLHSKAKETEKNNLKRELIIDEISFEEAKKTYVDALRKEAYPEMYKLYVKENSTADTVAS
jgi:hypothetical protein